VTFTFPDTRPTLDPGEIVVVIPQGQDVEAFKALYSVPAEVTVHGGAAGFIGALNNAGEEVALLRPDKPDNVPGQGIVVPLIQVDSISYDDAAPWPSGMGKSIERIDLEAFGDEPANWRTTEAEFATPGTGAPEPLIGYGKWADTEFTEAELAGPNTGVTDDFNGDGYPNLFAYAFGFSPKVNVLPAWLPVAIANQPGIEPHIFLAYRRLIDRPDVSYTVEQSTDGVIWGTDGLSEIGVEGNSDGTETVTVSPTPNLSLSPRLLLRVSLTYEAP
jgi:hypothetical protein